MMIDPMDEDQEADYFCLECKDTRRVTRKARRAKIGGEPTDEKFTYETDCPACDRLSCCWGRPAPVVSKCCALSCGKPCHWHDGVELPFCLDHAKDEERWKAWDEIT